MGAPPGCWSSGSLGPALFTQLNLSFRGSFFLHSSSTQQAAESLSSHVTLDRSTNRPELQSVVDSPGGRWLYGGSEVLCLFSDHDDDQLTLERAAHFLCARYPFHA